MLPIFEKIEKIQNMKYTYIINQRKHTGPMGV